MNLYAERDRQEAIRRLMVRLPKWEFEFVKEALGLYERQTPLAPPAAANREIAAEQS